jgi:hypothetical protein
MNVFTVIRRARRIAIDKVVLDGKDEPVGALACKSRHGDRESETIGFDTVSTGELH